MIDVQYIAETQTTPKKIDLLDDIISFHSGYKNKQKKRQNFWKIISDGCRTIIAWIFSNVGICVLVIGYLLLGATMFQAIEGNTEDNSINKIVLLRNETVYCLWNITEKYNLFYPKNWTKEVDSIIKHYQKEIVDAENKGFDGNDIPIKLWNFSGALLYSITVITTIGYGHIVPVTPIGKIVSIFYAVFGVPLFLLYLSNIGNILATSFKWTYSQFFKCEIVKKKNDIDKYSVHQLTHQIHPGIMKFSEIGNEQDNMSVSGSFPSSSVIDEKNENLVKKSDKVAVPITLSLAVMISYICGGAILFGEWEGWNFLDGFYFCFITLSTIGFGDILPGDAVDQDENEANLGGLVNIQFIFCSLYILLGMAVIAMCFNLMQEKVVQAMITLGKNLGIVNFQ